MGLSLRKKKVMNKTEPNPIPKPLIAPITEFKKFGTVLKFMKFLKLFALNTFAESI